MNNPSADLAPLELLSAAIPVEHLAKLRHDIESLGSRCLRKGMPEPELRIGAAHFIPDPRRSAPASRAISQIEVVDVSLALPELIALAGWSLLGRVDPLPDGRPLVVRVPGTQNIPLPAVRSPYECLYCGKVRTRRETFLVVHQSGRTSQVGRTCLRDFLGHDPSPLLWWAARLEELRLKFVGWSGAGTGVRFYFTDEVLSLAARVAARDGYLGRSRANQINHGSGTAVPVEPTSAKVAWRLDVPPFPHRARISRSAAITAWDARYADDATAQELLALTRAELSRLDAAPTSEWEANVTSVTSNQMVREAHLGIAVSAVVLGLKLQDKITRAKILPPSRHLGTVGERLHNLDAVIVLIKQFDAEDSIWGGRTLLKFQTDEAALLWWASGSPTRREPPYTAWALGDRVRLTGTVRAHQTDRYDGRPITVLTRCLLEPSPVTPVAYGP